MSGISTPGGSGNPGLPNLATGADPSMEDILASIRRILSEDEHASPRPAEAAAHDGPAVREPEEVYNLDASMIVEEQVRSTEPIVSEQPRPEVIVPEIVKSEPIRAEPTRAEPIRPEMPAAVTAEPAPSSMQAQQREVPPPPLSGDGPDSLVAPAAAAAAAMSLGSLRRTLDAERQPGTRGITVEEMVREGLRPVLKTWLDENLAPIVERLVRAEIERVVGRSNS